MADSDLETGSTTISNASDTSTNNSTRSLLRRIGNVFNKPVPKQCVDSDDPSPFDKVHIRRTFEERPGFPRVASFLASAPDFLLHRNPTISRNRLLLFRVSKIQRIEEQLRELDIEDYEDDPYILQSQLEDHVYDLGRTNPKAQRLSLMEELDAELRVYDDLLIRERTLRSFDAPSKDSHNSVLEFLRMERPLVPEEEAPWLDPHELVSLAAGRDSSWLERAIGRLLRKIGGNRAQKLFTKPGMRVVPGQIGPVYFTSSRIAILTNVVTIAASLISTLVPAILLFFLESRLISIVVLIVALLVFSIVLAACTSEKPHRTFLHVAAVCAILVAVVIK